MKESKEWKGPSDNLERLLWVLAGKPSEEDWAIAKWEDD